MLRNLEKSVSKFISKFFKLDNIAFILGGILLSSVITYTSKLDNNSNSFIFIMSLVICFSVWLYNKKDSKITNYLELSIFKDIVKKFFIFTIATVAIIVCKRFFISNLLIPNAKDIMFIKTVFGINIFSIIRFVIISLENFLTNNLVVIFTLLLLSGILISVKRMSKYYGNKAFFAMFLGIIYMCLSLMLNLGSIISVLGFIGVMDAYLHKEQYLFAISLPYLLTKYLIGKFNR